MLILPGTLRPQRALNPVERILGLVGLSRLARDVTYMFAPNHASRVAGNRHYLYMNGQWVDQCPLTAGSMAATGEITGGSQSISVSGTVESFSIIWNNSGLPVVAFSVGFNRALTTAERTALSSTTFWAAILPAAISVANCTALYPWLAPMYQSLVGWWDASAIVGLANNDPCGTWSDKSGLAYHATQTTASRKPTYLVNRLNALPMLSFDDGDVLNCAAVNVPKAVYTTFIVGYGNEMLFCTAYTSDDGHYVYRSPAVKAAAGGVKSAWSAAAATWQDAPSKVIMAQCDGTHANHKIFVNGASVRGAEIVGETSDPGSAADSLTHHIGANATPAYYLLGEIAEIVHFRSAIAAEDISAVKNYLSAKWGIAVA